MNRAFGPLLCILVALVGCSPPPPDDTQGDQISVVAAVYPLAWLAQEVGGEAVVVTDLGAGGGDAHDLELTASQVRAIQQADLLVFLGEGFQPAVEDVVEGLDDDKRLDALEFAEGVTGPPLEDEAETSQDEHGHTEEDEHGHAGEDPHVWLDPLVMAGLAQEIAQRLGSQFPREAAGLSESARSLGEQLEGLHAEIQNGLATCERREIVVSHEAFGYLTTRYGLEQLGIAGLTPESEPSPQRLAELSALVRERGVTTIFFERDLSPALAETVARETGAATALLDTLESRPPDADYLSSMRENLSTLRQALGCS